MNSWIKRIKFYGIGFGIGLLFVFFFFENRGCSWMPSNRVKNAILDRLIVVSEKTEILMNQKGVDANDILLALNSGDIDFIKSRKDIYPKCYVISTGKMNFVFTLPYESFISEVFFGDKTENVCNSKNGYGDIIHFPNDDNLLYIDSNEYINCQKELIGLKNSNYIFDLIKSSGKIDFSQTNFDQTPKPEHHISFRKDEKEIGCTIIWYKNKLNIITFDSVLKADCDSLLLN